MTVLELIDLLAQHDPNMSVGAVVEGWHGNVRLVFDAVECDIEADEDSNILRIVTPGKGAIRMLILDLER